MTKDELKNLIISDLSKFENQPITSQVMQQMNAVVDARVQTFMAENFDIPNIRVVQDPNDPTVVVVKGLDAFCKRAQE